MTKIIIEGSRDRFLRNEDLIEVFKKCEKINGRGEGAQQGIHMRLRRSSLLLLDKRGLSMQEKYMIGGRNNQYLH